MIFNVLSEKILLQVFFLFFFNGPFQVQLLISINTVFP